MKKALNTIELFAGVGGFRIGLEKADPQFFKTIYANQWEPSKKAQYAFECYNQHFPNSKNTNIDINKLPNKEFSNLNADLLVGGFPCQDYSVARSLNNELGISGKKGVLFWEIKRVIEITRPKYVLLENVDRLLKSPSTQRGRDFSVMLAVLRELGYDVEWRVINAADYGAPQRRRRIFIFAYDKNINYAQNLKNFQLSEILYEKGFFQKKFLTSNEAHKQREANFILPKDIVEISDDFSKQYYNSGIMINGEIKTIELSPIKKNPTKLKDILEKEVSSDYFLSEKQIEKIKYLRGAKKIERTSKNGHTYIYSEGGMSETDDLNKPSRTMLTSEGTINRSSHIIKDQNSYRFLTPTETERLNQFPDNWTENMPERNRYFCMGNALVTSIIQKIGTRIKEIENKEKQKNSQIEFFL
jgi:DNA (cytosine-5)-methyltransferase 1